MQVGQPIHPVGLGILGTDHAWDPQKGLLEVIVLLRQLYDGLVERDEERDLKNGGGKALQWVDLLLDVHPRHLLVDSLLIACVPPLDLPHHRLHLAHASGRSELTLVKWVEQGLDEASVKDQGETEATRISSKSVLEVGVNELNEKLVDVHKLLEDVKAGLLEELAVVWEAQLCEEVLACSAVPNDLRHGYEFVGS